MISTYSAIIFDMDGVLIDAREWHYAALNEALSIFGEEIHREEHLAVFDGLPTRIKLRKLIEAGRLASGLEGQIEAVKQERTLRAAARLCFPNIQHLIMLAEIKRLGYKIGVATNSVRASAESMLGFAGILDFLDVLITNEDVIKPKPDPSIYVKACQVLRVDPNRALVFEDNPYGVQAAQAAGCQVVTVKDPLQINLPFVESWLMRAKS